jgi:hypothetical protein
VTYLLVIGGLTTFAEAWAAERQWPRRSLGDDETRKSIKRPILSRRIDCPLGSGYDGSVSLIDGFILGRCHNVGQVAGEGVDG